jgi:hypothetical protein
LQLNNSEKAAEKILAHASSYALAHRSVGGAQAHPTRNMLRKVMVMPRYGSADDLTALAVT